jgi:cytochrome c peroxidase
MKNRIFTLTAIAIGASIMAISCKKETPGAGSTSNLFLQVPKLPNVVNNYSQPEFPSYLNMSQTTFSQLVNDDVATLGRVLFYDKNLSINNATACASCHLQSMGFADGMAASKGFSFNETLRNSMSIVNVWRQQGFFWDLRERDLSSMVLKPIQNHVEMGFNNMDYVVNKLKDVTYYKPLFEKAYPNQFVSQGQSLINKENISQAITQFLKSMVTYNSKYDIGKESNFANFTVQELAGKDIFTNKMGCNSCHSEPEFAPSWGNAYANIGLDMDYKDKGVNINTFSGNPNPINPGQENTPEGLFKIPSLRNIALTAPYMHDGRFATLEEVVEHYSSGIKNHPNLNWELINIRSNFNSPDNIDPRVGLPGKPGFFNNGGTSSNPDEIGKPKRWNLTDEEKSNLVAFLKTLTDYKLTHDAKFSNPFVSVK